MRAWALDLSTQEKETKPNISLNTFQMNFLPYTSHDKQKSSHSGQHNLVTNPLKDAHLSCERCSLDRKIGNELAFLFKKIFFCQFYRSLIAIGLRYWLQIWNKKNDGNEENLFFENNHNCYFYAIWRGNLFLTNQR